MSQLIKVGNRSAEFESKLEIERVLMDRWENHKFWKTYSRPTKYQNSDTAESLAFAQNGPKGELHLVRRENSKVFKRMKQQKA